MGRHCVRKVKDHAHVPISTSLTARAFGSAIGICSVCRRLSRPSTLKDLNIGTSCARDPNFT